MDRVGWRARDDRPVHRRWLIAVASWRWIFFINLPIGFVVLPLAVRHAPGRAAHRLRTGSTFPGRYW